MKMSSDSSKPRNFWRHGRFVYRVGDWVRVPGVRGRSQIRFLYTRIEGGVILDKPLDFTHHWNVDALVKIKKRRSRP